MDFLDNLRKLLGGNQGTPQKRQVPPQRPTFGINNVAAAPMQRPKPSALPSQFSASARPRLSPEAQNRINANEARLRQAQSDVWNPAKIAGDIGNAARELGNGINENFIKPTISTVNKAANTLAVPVTGVVGGASVLADRAFNKGRNSKYLADATRSQINDQLRNSFVSPEVAQGRASPLEFGKQFTQAGVETSNLIPTKGVVTGLSRGFSRQGIKTSLAANAGQAGVLGTANIGNDALQGRQITPESVALNYGAPFALGVGSDIVGGALRSGTKATTQAVKESTPRRQAAQDPEVLGHDPQYADLGKLWDTTTDPLARRQISQAMADNRLARLQTQRRIQSRMSQGGSQPAGNFDPTGMAGKSVDPNAPQVGKTVPVIQNSTAARQMENKNSPQIDQSQNTNLDLAPVDTRIQAGKEARLPRQLDTLNETLPSTNPASSKQVSQQEMPAQSPQVGVDQSLGGLRSRGFIETIRNDANTPQLVKDSVSSLYEVRNTKDLQIKAAELVKRNPDMAQRIASSDSGDISAMVGSELIKLHSARGNYEQAIATAHEVARQATEHGRASQALSAYAKLTPEGILRFTQSEINKFNTANKLANGKEIVLTPEAAKSLTDKSTALQSMPEGRAKDIETQKMLKEVKDILPVGWVKKVSTLQTIGQLLNPKTTMRNILGNAIFGTMDNVSQVGAAGLDKVTSAVLKSERTTALPNLKVQATSAVKGGKQAYEETLQGINLGPDTQFDLAQVPVFKSKFMQGVEKTLGITLRVPDRAAYTAAFDDTLNGLMKANKIDTPTQQMLDLANANGLYRTFQDNSKAAQLFTGLKGALNHVGVEKNGTRFGLGDFILKYPKTPGNIISRGLDYSPVGIIKGLYQIAKPAITKQPFDQHTFVNSISRGTLGTGGLIGAGAVLGALGIITEKPSQDTDTRNLQKASGQGGYQINVSALTRFFQSGFNKESTAVTPGDTLVSYDWAQPLSIPLSAGAAIGKGESAIDGATSTVENLTGGLNTLVEQPLISGLNTFANNIKNKGVIGALGETAKSAPASFIPTASNQIRQLTDNTSRSTYDPSAVNTSANKVINRIPFLEKMLPEQIDSLGNSKENYADGGNNVFNVMLNPSFVTKYNPDAAAKLPLDILSRSGETQQMPRTTRTSQKVSGEDIKLTATQNHDFQQYVGKHTNDYYNQLLGNDTFMAKTDGEKAKIMSAGLTDISKAGKIAILGDTSKSSAAQRLIASGGDVYKTASGMSTTKLDSNSLSYKFLDNANVISNEEKGTWNKQEVSAEYKSFVDNINNVVPEGVPKLPATNGVAKLYADFEKNKADNNWSELQTKKESKKVINEAYKSQLTDNEKFISTLSDKEILSAAQNNEVSEDEIKNIIGIDNILNKLGMTQMIGNKTRAALGFGSLGSGRGGRSKGGSSKKSISDYLTASNNINTTTANTYKTLQDLLAGTTARKSTQPKQIGRKVALNKITVKGA